jgi:hypothetical protein
VKDYKAELAAARAKQALDKQLKKAGDKRANISFAGGRKPKVEEELPPTLEELELPEAHETRLKELIGEHRRLNAQIKPLAKRKKEIAEDVKPICKLYGMEKFLVNGSASSYYKTTKSTIVKELLLANGVPPDVIIKSTVTTDSWAFKSGKEDDDA